MKTHEDAKHAIKVLNGKKMSEQSTPLSVVWDTNKRNEILEGEGTVFVKGIKKDVTTNQIKQIFEECDEILFVKLSTNKNNESNGYAYVRFVEDKGAEIVLNPSVIRDIQNLIGEENFTIEKCVESQKQEKRNIYFENIDINCTDEQIINYFKQFGGIDVLFSNDALCVKIVLDKVLNMKKGYVMYKKHENALKAIQFTHEKKIKELDDSVLRSSFFKSKLELKMERKRKALEIKNNIKNKYKKSNIQLTSERTELTVKEIIDKLGDGKKDIFYNIRLKQNFSEPVKTAFVCFYNVEDANLAIKM
ncbi:Polyadenylate-binding protein [Entamoeba marina]